MIQCQTVNVTIGTCTSTGIFENFENGNIGTITQSPTNTYTMNFGDNAGRIWFHIKLCNLKDRLLTFILKGVRNDHWYSSSYVTVSNDKWNWNKIFGTLSNCTNCGQTFNCCDFRWTYTPTTNEEYISFPYPFSNWQLDSFITSNSSTYMTITNMTTAENRTEKLITITDPTVSDTGKKVVFLVGREDGWETMGTHMLIGGIKYLLSTDSLAINLRKGVIFKIVPIVTVDFVAKGWVNRVTQSWTLPTSETPKEVQNLKDYITSWKNSGKSIDLVGRFHSNGIQSDGSFGARTTTLKNAACNRLSSYITDCGITGFPYGGGRFFDFVNDIYNYNIPDFTYEAGFRNRDSLFYENLGVVTMKFIADYFGIT